MVVLGVAPALGIPILDRANDVRFVRRAELQFHLVASARFCIAQEEVEATRVGLTTLDLLDIEIPEAKQGRVVHQERLDPLLSEVRTRME